MARFRVYFGSVEVTAAITGAAATIFEDLRVATGTQGVGVVAIQGTSAPTLDALTSVSVGTVALAGAGAITLDALTTASAGTVAVTGAATPALGALTVGATGTAALGGSAAITLGDLTAAAAGTVSMTGTAAPTLDPLTAAAAGVVGSTPILGNAAMTFAPLTSAAIGRLLIQGLFGDGPILDENGDPILDENGDPIVDEGAPLGLLTLVGAGTVTVEGSRVGTLTRSLDSLTLVAAGTTPFIPPTSPPHRTRTLTRGRGTIPLGPGSTRGNIPLGPGKRRRRP